MDISFDSPFSYLAELISNKDLFPLYSIILVISFYLYFRNKSKSGFSISNKLYMILIGYTKDKKNEKKRDLIDDIIDIERFNFHYNTNATSKRQIARFEEWVSKYELDFRLISKLKRYFDIDTLRVKKINKFYLTGVFILLFIPLLATVQSFTIAIKPALLAKMNTTGWFWINNDNATKFSFFDKAKDPWVIDTKICSSKEDNSTKILLDNKISSFNKKEIKAICKAFIDKDDIEYINKSIKEQQSFFLFCICHINYISSDRF
ncbi:DUF6216 family protein [Escherichia coli]